MQTVKLLSLMITENFVRTMDKLGYKHQGFPVGYDSMSQIRWLSVLDLKR